MLKKILAICNILFAFLAIVYLLFKPTPTDISKDLIILIDISDPDKFGEIYFNEIIKRLKKQINSIGKIDVFTIKKGETQIDIEGYMIENMPAYFYGRTVPIFFLLPGYSAPVYRFFNFENNFFTNEQKEVLTEILQNTIVDDVENLYNISNINIHSLNQQQREVLYGIIRPFGENNTKNPIFKKSIIISTELGNDIASSLEIIGNAITYSGKAKNRAVLLFLSLYSGNSAKAIRESLDSLKIKTEDSLTTYNMVFLDKDYGTTQLQPINDLYDIDANVEKNNLLIGENSDKDSFVITTYGDLAEEYLDILKKFIMEEDIENYDLKKEEIRNIIITQMKNANILIDELFENVVNKQINLIAIKSWEIGFFIIVVILSIIIALLEKRPSPFKSNFSRVVSRLIFVIFVFAILILICSIGAYILTGSYLHPVSFLILLIPALIYILGLMISIFGILYMRRQKQNKIVSMELIPKLVYYLSGFFNIAVIFNLSIGIIDKNGNTIVGISIFFKICFMLLICICNIILYPTLREIMKKIPAIKSFFEIFKRKLG